MIVVANFATPYVATGWVLTAVVLGGYALRMAVRTRRAQRQLGSALDDQATRAGS